MRTLVFTGKGGVGKTTVAAATAARASDLGYRTLIISTDPAHSLSDAFGVDLSHQMLELRSGLYAREVEAQKRLEEGWGEIRDHLLAVLDWSGMEGVEAEELAVLPGLDEVFALVDIVDYAASGKWDLLVIDSAPTGETLRFLSLPDVLKWWMRRIWPTSRSVVRAVRPVLSRVSGIPVASEAVMDATESLYERLAAAKSILSDAKQSSIRLVLNPEKVVIAEAMRTWTYLSLFGYSVDAVVANRILPEGVSDPWFDDWRESQARNLETVHTAFDPMPILTVPLARREPIGLTRLDELASEIYGDADPSLVMYSDESLTVAQVPEGYDLHLRLPGAGRNEIDVSRRDDELFIKAGSWKRNLLLPQALRRREIAEARFGDGELLLMFR